MEAESQLAARFTESYHMVSRSNVTFVFSGFKISVKSIRAVSPE